MEILDDDLLLDEKELLTSIWTKPKLTLEYILKHCPKKYVTALLILNGASNGLERNYSHMSGNNSISLFMWVIAIVFGGLLGWLFSYIFAAMLSWTGGWLKGKAESDSFVTVIAWAAVPAISSVVFIPFKLLFFGGGTFYLDVPTQGLWKVILFLFIALIEIGLSIWSLVILIKGIAIVQQFNIKKATLNAALPVLVILIPILIIAGIIYLFS